MPDYPYGYTELVSLKKKKMSLEVNENEPTQTVGVLHCIGCVE